MKLALACGQGDRINAAAVVCQSSQSSFSAGLEYVRVKDGDTGKAIKEDKMQCRDDDAERYLPRSVSTSGGTLLVFAWLTLIRGPGQVRRTAPPSPRA